MYRNYRYELEVMDRIKNYGQIRTYKIGLELIK